MLKFLHTQCLGSENNYQDHPFMPRTICGSCYTMLMRWEKEPKLEQLKFRKPMIWSTPLGREDCYFCMTDIRGSRSNSKAGISYAEVSSVMRPDTADFVDKKTSKRNEPMDMDPIKTGEME
ncbi:hypothetical protein QAD02_018168 [Eretmocerus hayati]|uniref:Uncharacterized protein n=1 Tax=Eretmocerus hayati TaxID=131215 RepID=A0ACC2PHW0_9HYME|nr:hypothetical protein QAD02_018168 [Eretmocerus hayati]